MAAAEDSRWTQSEEQHDLVEDYLRGVEEDAGIPGHVGEEKQLHSGTGYNLVVEKDGRIYGTREPYNRQAILQIVSRKAGEVQMKGKYSKFYIAMNEKGKIYPEEDKDSVNTWFAEHYADGWNSYIWKCNNEKDWYLAIKKSGKMKKGPKTRKGQRSVKFLPRPIAPPK